MSVVGVTAASAATENASQVALFTKVNGKPVQLTDTEVAAHVLTLDAPASDSAEGPTVAPYLIDWNQWFGCFSLNNANDVSANYMFWYDGRGQDVRLKCGESGKWGYKHIREGKEADWQNKLDAARAAGWQASALGVESWDDLMSGVTAGLILYPDYLRKDTVNNKWCANNEFYLQDVNTGRELYSFRVEAAWASDSDRLITSLPTSRTYC